ncbi:MAG: mucoidy inhibitor MuiA family protein, partial [Variovorax sp.]
MHTAPLAPLRHAVAAALMLGAAAGASAQSADSRITQVKVYPGSATVERVARVAAGSRTLTFACLPAGLNVQSLQVSADASVRVGETSVLTEPRALSSRCATSALDGRIRTLEDQKAGLQAESEALDLVTGYLKGLSGAGDDGAGRRAAVDARSIAAVTDALRRTGQDSLQKQHQLKRRQDDIDRELKPLLAERTRAQGSGGNVSMVTVTLAATADADVKLSYQVNGPGWTPTYRALLDTTTRRLRIERQALVAQATGEDWRGVKLVLSTGQPRRETTGRLPSPWRIGVA